MARQAETYSRVIAWLKIILPLIALGLLSTLFLLSRTAEPSDTIPFADPNMVSRAANQQVTAPRFSGTTADGDVITLRASKAQPSGLDDGVALASDLNATLALTDGSQVILSARNARIDEPSNQLVLDGSVRVVSTTGYEILTEGLVTAMDQVSVESTGPVQGIGPVGRFTAGKMTLSRSGPDGGAQLVFTDGVKLVYDPKE